MTFKEETFITLPNDMLFQENMNRIRRLELIMACCTVDYFLLLNDTRGLLCRLWGRSLIWKRQSFNVIESFSIHKNFIYKWIIIVHFACYLSIAFYSRTEKRSLWTRFDKNDREFNSESIASKRKRSAAYQTMVKGSIEWF